MIAGSANISKRSKTLLDEAAIWTNDEAVVRRARNFIERLCTEPIRPEYLKICKEQYKPPRMNGSEGVPRKAQARVNHPKLWIVNLSDSYSLPPAETARYAKSEAKAEHVIKDAVRSKTDSFHWPHKPRMADELEPGDWLIMAIKHKDKNVQAPALTAILLIDSYVRNSQSRKERWVFHLEVPLHVQPMKWNQFQSAVRSRGIALAPGPRTQPIRDVDVADTLLRVWTAGGRISSR